MDKINLIKNWIVAAASLAGSALITHFGGWDTGMQTLIVFIAVDYVCGLIVAGIFHKSRKTETGTLESRAGLKGIFRKIGILFAVIVAVYLDRVLGDAAFARTAVILFFCANEGLSIVENLGLMGVPFPVAVKKALEQLHKDKPDKAEEVK